jgi:hypothetical protein
MTLIVDPDSLKFCNLNDSIAAEFRELAKDIVRNKLYDSTNKYFIQFLESSNWDALDSEAHELIWFGEFMFQLMDSVIEYYKQMSVSLK